MSFSICLHYGPWKSQSGKEVTMPHFQKLQQFLGFAHFYNFNRNFVRNYGQLASLLTQLTFAATPFSGLQEQRQPSAPGRSISLRLQLCYSFIPPDCGGGKHFWCGVGGSSVNACRWWQVTSLCLVLLPPLTSWKKLRHGGSGAPRHYLWRSSNTG